MEEKGDVLSCAGLDLSIKVMVCDSGVIMVSLLSLVSNIRHFEAVYREIAASAEELFGDVYSKTAAGFLSR